jgi:phosphoserine phosphatase RsbX
VAVLGRACEGEDVSGDQAAFVRTEDGLLLAVVDGLGHGPLAREAADRAVEAFRRHASSGLASILTACHEALLETRGAVMTVVRIDEAGGRLEHAGVGDVAARVVAPSGSRSRSFGATVFVLGSPGMGKRTARVQVGPFAPGSALLQFTDGLVSRTGLDDALDLLREPPVAIAEHLLGRFARADDDALVVVVR